ncbi:uncharacterized protein QC761_0023680 [Podospora bellae-mahoneyi]|uniref:Uncharacterized protein n=1 Tax=Podospora bellae-mahoneyi TaxID=2093777 RepID=A0ABR0G1R0_9PEZI|nr:hypothetical protein QC761_0023680 [Podospora bellae-mahoneyi]
MVRWAPRMLLVLGDGPGMGWLYAGSAFDGLIQLRQVHPGFSWSGRLDVGSPVIKQACSSFKS